MEEIVPDIVIYQLVRPRKRTQPETPSQHGRAKPLTRLTDDPTKQLHAAATAAEEHRETGLPPPRERVAASLEVHQVTHDDERRLLSKLGIDIWRVAWTAGVVVGQRLAYWRQWID